MLTCRIYIDRIHYCTICYDSGSFTQETQCNEEVCYFFSFIVTLTRQPHIRNYGILSKGTTRSRKPMYTFHRKQKKKQHHTRYLLLRCSFVYQFLLNNFSSHVAF